MTTTWQLTYTGVTLAVFANQICLPVPSIVFLMAAGAISAHGEMRASIIVLLAVVGYRHDGRVHTRVAADSGDRAVDILLSSDVADAQPITQYFKIRAGVDVSRAE